jgi:hypothetical protein
MRVMANVLHDAFSSAYPQWEAVIRHAGWHSMLVAAGYALAGALCCASGLAARSSGGGGAWLLAGALLALLGANALARVDLLTIYVLRDVAQAQGWYGQRRAWQLLALGALALATLLALGWFHPRLRAERSRSTAAVLGVSLLVGVAALRAISLHYTDRALDAHLAGITTGRLLELAGLGLTAAGALRHACTA